MRRASKIDRNQPEVVEKLREIGARVCKCGAPKDFYAAVCRKCRFTKMRADRAEADTLFRCPLCGGKRSRKSKTCGERSCQTASKRLAWSSHTIKRSPVNTCCHCQGTFHASPSRKRKYCSYLCFVASGGSFRAGLAASAAMRRYGAKRDANHAPIISRLRELNVPVYDLASVGAGVPDGIAWVADAWRLFEIKNPKTGYGRRGLNPIQKKWIEHWKGGPIYLISDIKQAELFAAAKFSELKSHGGGAV